MKLLGRIGITPIFRRHFQTFYNYGRYQFQGDKKVPFADIFTFVLLPLAISILIIWLDPNVIKEFTELITTSLSIFVGLLFSLLTLVFDLAKKEKERLKVQGESHADKAIFTLTKELFVNIAYSIALSILCMGFVFISRFRPHPLIERIKRFEHFETVRYFSLATVNVIVCFLLIQFLLTLLMILKRFFIIFNKQIEAE